jgi:hypothetical protein
MRRAGERYVTDYRSGPGGGEQSVGADPGRRSSCEVWAVCVLVSDAQDQDVVPSSS